VCGREHFYEDISTGQGVWTFETHEDLRELADIKPLISSVCYGRRSDCLGHVVIICQTGVDKNSLNYS
jgi:hypothetical protein